MEQAKNKSYQEALERALTNNSEANYKAIYEGFVLIGIPESDIEPRVNVLTFKAWKAINRVVIKGEKGVKVITRIPCKIKDKETGKEISVLKTKITTVFHISQTKPLDEQQSEPKSNHYEIEQQPEPELNPYEMKLQARRERYKELSDKAKSESRSYYNRAKDMASLIPFGQPILVGHYSEKRDRNYRNKIHNTFGKSFKLLDKANYYEDKASKIGGGGISSDDPNAIKKLKDKLDNCVKSQELMKKCNKIIRTNKSDEEKTNEIIELGISEKNAIELVKGDFLGKKGFASYSLQNNNAEINRIKNRISGLESRKGREEVKEEYNNFTFIINNEENRIMFIFKGKPGDEVREILKKNAIKWSPTRKAWIRKITPNALHAARSVKEKIKN
ncbi:DUF3560 domain-containing protein [Photorhabdus asymbiotica]|uniref:DUF3560 domain-containing protein n=1 Tax=Photorhabdus asymbiotica TaxID=291112 RepID=UPI003DA7906B